MPSAKQAKIEAAHNEGAVKIGNTNQVNTNIFRQPGKERAPPCGSHHRVAEQLLVAVAMIAVMKAFEEKDEAAFFAALSADPLSLIAVEENCVSSYTEERRQQVEKNGMQELLPDVLRFKFLREKCSSRNLWLVQWQVT
ncbi:Hypothetical predicted protein [Cloeon dipterum]|uniref:Uncharacterized protein n=1 Tax=Cloeon dipterum TaxID=197152 RepID=A0A8S1C6T4_9INSE|nr:Hypothetical predicted protein [Cloeon dipterum]